jgi:hypothetical protein
VLVGFNNHKEMTLCEVAALKEGCRVGIEHFKSVNNKQALEVGDDLFILESALIDVFFEEEEGKVLEVELSHKQDFLRVHVVVQRLLAQVLALGELEHGGAYHQVGSGGQCVFQDVDAQIVVEA